jgi:hypothetical protein
MARLYIFLFDDIFVQLTPMLYLENKSCSFKTIYYFCAKF